PEVRDQGASRKHSRRTCERSSVICLETVNPAASLPGPGDATVPRVAPVAQGIERAPPERKVVGSIPTGRILTRAAMRKPAFLHGSGVTHTPDKHAACYPRCYPGQAEARMPSSPK